MLIRVDEEKRLFHLNSGDSSYIMGVNPQNFLAHGYWGRKLPEGDYRYLLETPGHASFEACEDNENGYWFSPNCMKMEFPREMQQLMDKLKANGFNQIS
jgi:alpha-galactosidase